MMWLLLAQLTFAQWERVAPPVLHQGFVQLCGDDERVLEHRVGGVLVWELHLSKDSLGLYAFRMADGDHTHTDPLNLLSGPRLAELPTLRGARQWTVPTLRLWVSVVRAGEAEADNCESFYIRVERK